MQFIARLFIVGGMENVKTHINNNGEKYYSRCANDGSTEYSFTIDFEDTWTDEQEDYINEMEGYIKPAIVKSQYGNEIEIDVKTTKEAKQKASKWAQFGSGTITLELGLKIYQREFWQNLNNFGWHEWKEVTN